MPHTYAYREKRNAIAAWLCDNYGDDTAIDPFFWRDAADLITFLTAHGFEVRARG